MLEIKVWLVIVLCIELPAIGYVVIHSPLMKLLKAIGFDWFMAVGIYMLTAGLFVQIGRTLSYLNTNK